MKYVFTHAYELDTNVACAVAAYLDAEHYIFLHNKYSPQYEVLSHVDDKIMIRQTWLFRGRRVAQICTCEYIAPARFLNYDIKSDPWWKPSVHHLVKTRTDLRYYPDETGERTISHLTVELRMPFFLYPLRHLIEKKMRALKEEKDKEDIEMIDRRAELFGRGNAKAYLADHQFMLHKDEFVEHFASDDPTVGSPPDEPIRTARLLTADRVDTSAT